MGIWLVDGLVVRLLLDFEWVVVVVAMRFGLRVFSVRGVMEVVE